MPIRYKLAAAAGLLLAMWGLDSLQVGRPNAWSGSLGPVRILRFFASDGAIAPGGSAMLCYGVENAKSVQIAPLPLKGVYPSAGRCIEVAPERTTNYTIRAVGFDGTVAMQSLTLPVEAEPPERVVPERVVAVPGVILVDPPSLRPSSPGEFRLESNGASG